MSSVPTRRATSPFLIGIFVIFGTLSIIGIIIWLGASQFLKENVEYVTYFSGSVEGLEKGSPVKYMGVPVGSVNKLRVAPDGKLIEVILVIDKKITIGDSLRVKSELAGLTGSKFLQLHYPHDSIVLRSYPYLSFKPPFKLIKSAPSGIEEIEIAAREVMNNLNQFQYGQVSEEIINFLQTTTDFFNNKELFGIITNLNASSERLNSIFAHADTSKIIDNLSATSQRFLATSQKLEKFSDSLNFQLQAINLSGKLDKALAQYDSLMNNAKTVLFALGYRFDSAIFGFDETLNEIRKTNKQLQKTLRTYSNDPGRLLLSEPPPLEK